MRSDARKRVQGPDGGSVSCAQRVVQLGAEVERLRAALAEAERERLAFSGRLGFGDDRSEPAATLEQMLNPIEQAFSDAHEHAECPVICEPCGETLAATICEHCNGSGCGPGTASLAYSECDWCAGVGRVHVGCAEQSYADLEARAKRAEWERDEAREQGTKLADGLHVWRDDAMRYKADAEQAERQVRAGLALADEWERIGKRESVRPTWVQEGVAELRLVTQLRAALSGVSGPTASEGTRRA